MSDQGVLYRKHIENMYKKSTKIANVNQNYDLWI